MKRSRLLQSTGAAVILVAALVVAVTLGRDKGETPATTVVTAASVAVTSPYDFTEGPADTPDFQTFSQAKFLSLTLPGTGGYQSFLMKRDTERFSQLVAALASAVGADPPPVEPAATTPELRPTLTVVMEGRKTYTFTVDRERGLLVRGERAWKLHEDLGAVLDRVTK